VDRKLVRRRVEITAMTNPRFGLLALVACTACFTRSHTFVARTPVEFRNSSVVRVQPEGVVRLARGSHHSPAMFVGSLSVGEAGICVEANVPPTAFWYAIRVSNVDPRIARAVLMTQPALRVITSSATSVELAGAPDALRAWMVSHLRATAAARRRFVDIPAIGYEVRSRFGWADATSNSLAHDTREWT
jgi:hypothetical protein